MNRTQDMIVQKTFYKLKTNNKVYRFQYLDMAKAFASRHNIPVIEYEHKAIAWKQEIK